MATAIQSAPSRLDAKIVHPLDRLRGTIRKYVVIEGLLSAAIFLAAWFALALLLDYGLFKVATWDWVLDAPAWLRGAALVIAASLLAALVVLRIVVRLRKELSYPALALVLERRFPKVLGDRLITAVELADVEHQARYGYSADMIRLTIDEARDRVGTVPVNDVFNWRRLRRMAALAVVLGLGTIVAGYAAFAISTGSTDPYRFGWRFTHVATALAERNVLVANAPWPRRAHLELANFEGGERRIPKDSPETAIKVTAYRWVYADRKATMGWRPMTWSDAERILGSVPALPVAAFHAAAQADLGSDPGQWTVDRIQSLAVDDQESRNRLSDQLPTADFEVLRDGLDAAFQALAAKAANPANERTFRKLEIPEKIALVYSGASKSGDATLAPLKNQEYESRLTDLKESVRFVVRAEDFRTPSKAIVLVPPPAFVSLTRTDFQPAYLHRTPPDFDYASLRGLRQRIADKPLTLTGDVTRIDAINDTEMTLTAVLDTDLTAAYLAPKVGVLPGAVPGSSERIPIPVGADKRTVVVEFSGDYRLSTGRTFDHYYFDSDGYLSSETVVAAPTLEFDLVVEQADGVTARRQVMIRIAEDQAPVVEVAPDVIRKVGNVYYVTPKARIPFNPESYVRDDHGLSKVAYEFTYWAEDTDVGRAVRVQLLTRSLLYPFGPANVPGAVAAAYHAAKFKDLDKGDQRQHGSAGLGRFIGLRANLTFETRDSLLTLLEKPINENDAAMITKIELKSPDVDYFDLKPLKLAASASEVQTRYRMDLNIVATDANYDTGPKTGENSEPIRLLIVSEGDLLAEINREEEAFAARLDEALVKLTAARNRWGVVRSFFGIPDRLEDAKVKAVDVVQEVNKAYDAVQGLVREYRRIHRECIVNDVTEATRDRFGRFANEIDRVVGENPPLVKDEVVVMPKMTFPEAIRRLEIVQAALNSNVWGDVTSVGSAEIGLLELEREVRAIRAKLGELLIPERLKAQLQKVIDDQERIGKQLAELRDIWVAGQFKKEPEFGTVGPVFLARGESKKIRHSINWRQYEKDDIALKCTVVDKDKKPVPANVLGVPATLKLDFEKNQNTFEYDVKAGAKDGEYTLTLTPAVGEPIVVTITVK